MAWVLSVLGAYFVLGFLENFYPAVWMLNLWGFFILAGLAFVLYYLIRDMFPRFRFMRHGLGLLILGAALLSSAAVARLLNQFPAWFDQDFFLLNVTFFPWFSNLAILPVLLLIQIETLERILLSSRAFRFLRANLLGLTLALVFFAVYFSLAVTYSLVLRDPTQNFDDNFYDTDPTSWMNRFAAPAGQLIEMRPVHPLAFLIFRPLTWFLSLFLNGERFYAALLLNAGAGALCVLLAWMLVKRWTKNSTYALIVAALLGGSTSHLILGTFLETYIFSAAALIAFLLALQSDRKPLKLLIPIGLLTFGVTITNFIQTGILLLAAEWGSRGITNPAGADGARGGFAIRRTPWAGSILKIIQYGLIVLALGLPLAWLQHVIYPTSQPFYDVGQMLAEDRYSTGLTTLERTLERGYSLGRTILLYSTVGPRPLALTEEVGCHFPCFKTYKPRYGPDLITSYAGFGSWVARAWFGILVIAGGLFAWKFVKSPKSVSLEVGLLLCVLFNFLLHVAYGDDPMLYSPDWTYALILFVALAFKDFADRKWFQAAALIFLAALMINNWTFLRAMLDAVAPYL